MKTKAASELVDLLGMPSRLLDLHPDCRKVLEAYQPPRPPSAGGETWMPRLTQLEGVNHLVLSAAHGKLVAWGLLRFELAEAQLGLRYQLTPEGRSALGHGFSVVSEESMDEGDTAGEESVVAIREVSSPAGELLPA